MLLKNIHKCQTKEMLDYFVATAGLEEAVEGIAKKYGKKASMDFASIEALGTANGLNVRHVVVLCRDICDNIHIMQRDIFLNRSGHGGYANGEGKHVAIYDQ